jgi:hypothetical protein
MTVRVYRSTDASAPVLTGAVGSLTALLDAVLVNGYGTQTAAGWTINQTTTNKRGYKQNLTGSNNTSGMCLYVDDTGPGAGGAREARVCGFESMSAITPTGTGQFPTSAQSAVGTGQAVIRKSTTADATARAWTCVANGQTIYLFIESGDNTAPLATMPFIFGDFKGYKSSDQYAVCIIGRLDENTGQGYHDNFHQVFTNRNGYTLTNTMRGHFVARHWTGVGGSKPVGKVIEIGKLGANLGITGSWGGDSSYPDTYNNGNSTIGRYAISSGLPTPNGADGALVLSPIFLNHNSSLRGYLPGLWAPLQDRPMGHNDTITIASGSLNGKSMVAQGFVCYVGNSNADAGLVLAETSDTWT